MTLKEAILYPSPQTHYYDYSLHEGQHPLPIHSPHAPAMAVPSILPAEATPLTVGTKRKHNEIIDLTEEDHDATATSSRNIVETLPAANRQSPHIDDDDETGDEEDEKILFEDLLDHFEISPYVNDGTSGLSDEQIDAMRAHLRHVGVEQFFRETLEQQGMNPRQLGIMFGLDPNLEIIADMDDAMYLRLLSVAVVRAYSKRKKLPQYNTIDDAAKLLRERRNIMVITGAGISTSLGIPDFRSKGTGFYERLREMGYEEPQEVFDIRNFDDDPRIFYSLAGDILPDQKQFSPTHAFIRLLQDKGRLQTNYTQNIDNLEALAGIDEDRVIQCHGSFATASCRKCKHTVKGDEIFPDIRNKRVARCKKCISTLQQPRPRPRPQKRTKSKNRNSWSDNSDEDDDIPEPGVMKPDITFFGEQLPTTFFDRFTERDAQRTDLVIVIGTSLKVAPVSEMPNYLPHAVPHIYISREPIQHVDFDIQLLGSCDDVVWELCRRAGWELRHEMIPTGFTAVVSAQEGTEHVWHVTPREREILESGSEDEDEEDVEVLEPVREKKSLEENPRNGFFKKFRRDFVGPS